MTSLFGILAMLLGLAASFGVVLVFDRFVESFYKDNAGRSILNFAVGVGVVGGIGLVCQIFRDRLDGVPDDDVGSRPSPKTGVVLLAVLVLPLILYWLQFEFFVTSIYMMPSVSILSGVLLAGWAVSHLKDTAYRRSLTFFAIVFVGLPLGVTAFSFPTNHFNRFGTEVVWIETGRNYEQHVFVFQADEYVPVEPLGAHDKLIDVAGAIGGAVEVDYAEKIRSGAWVERDGKLFSVDSDGSLEEILTGDAAMAWMESSTADAIKNDAEVHAQRKAEQFAAWEKARRGGRLFSSP